MGDFTGFTFGGVHSSELGIVRVSGGDRYDEELHPEIKDITAEVPGLDGNYYFGSNYGPRQFDIEIAFDSITEEQFRKIRKIFSSQKPQDLIFDERPYKKYIAKIESPVELSYVCFNEPKKHIDESGTARGVRWITESYEQNAVNPLTNELTGNTFATTHRVRETIYPYVMDSGTQRIYKGEGKISFICYFPFAKSVYKQLPEESEEWAISSGILSASDYSAFDDYSTSTSKINIYNAGDLDTGFHLYLPSATASAGTTLTYKFDGTNTTASLILNPITLKTGDIGILIDTVKELIIGVTNSTTYATSNNIYNEYINSGYFFKLKPNLDKTDGSILQITNGASGITIDYDYLYF